MPTAMVLVPCTKYCDIKQRGCLSAMLAVGYPIAEKPILDAAMWFRILPLNAKEDTGRKSQEAMKSCLVTAFHGRSDREAYGRWPEAPPHTPPPLCYCSIPRCSAKAQTTCVSCVGVGRVTRVASLLLFL